MHWLPFALLVAGQDAPAGHYKLEMENEFVRVYRIGYGAFESAEMHEHPDVPTVVYVYLTAGGRMRFTHDDGRNLVRPEVAAGRLLWLERGQTPTAPWLAGGNRALDYVRIELRSRPAR